MDGVKVGWELASCWRSSENDKHLLLRAIKEDEVGKGAWLIIKPACVPRRHEGKGVIQKWLSVRCGIIDRGGQKGKKGTEFTEVEKDWLEFV